MWQRSGEMSEWSIVHPWKGCVPLKRYRGFESPSLRQNETTDSLGMRTCASIRDASHTPECECPTKSARHTRGVNPPLSARIIDEHELGIKQKELWTIFWIQKKFYIIPLWKHLLNHFSRVLEYKLIPSASPKRVMIFLSTLKLPILHFLSDSTVKI